MTISVHGIGWLTKEGYGCIRSGLRHRYAIGEGAHILPKKDVFSHPFKNFGRLDTISKMTAFAVSLALQDAGIDYLPTVKQDIGIVGTNAEGSLRSDIEYFRDYLESGRTLSRGNLFIYTLPSSPIGEAAIHFGLLGPVLYAAGEGNALSTVLDTANEMILADEAPVMLAGKTEEDEAMFFVLGQERSRDGSVLCDAAEARTLVGTGADVAELVRGFIRIAARKG
jgi:3-oxoacyl-[acyl-carrier-protein] synthase II